MENELKFLKGSSSDYQGIEPVAGTFYYTTDDSKLYFGEKELTTPEDVTAAVTQVATNKNDIQKLKTEISTLVGGEDGQSIHDMIEAAVQNENTNYIGDKNSLNTEAKGTIVAAINEVDTNADAAKAAADEAKTASVITIKKSTGEADVATKYTIEQGGVALEQTIDIPKDMVVSSGEVVVVTAGDIAEDGKYHDKVDKAGTYIKLVLSDDAKTELFILVDTLVDIYKAASDAEKTKEIKVNVDNTTREISATIADGGVTTEKLATGAVTQDKIGAKAVQSSHIADGAITSGQLAENSVTGNAIVKGAITADKLAEGAITADVIGEGTITAEKLDEAVQENLTKASTALQASSITEGETNGTIAVNGSDINVHGLKSLAYKDESELALTGYVKVSEITEGSVDGNIDVAGTPVPVHNLSQMIKAGAEVVVNEKLVWEDIPSE